MKTMMAGRSGCRWEVTQGHSCTRKLESTPPTPVILVRTGEGDRNSLRGDTGGRDEGKTGLGTKDTNTLIEHLHTILKFEPQ